MKNIIYLSKNKVLDKTNLFFMKTKLWRWIQNRWKMTSFYTGEKTPYPKEALHGQTPNVPSRELCTAGQLYLFL